MTILKSLLLGSAAGLVAVAGAQAADLPVKAKPVQYVKICSLYGAGYYYIPGTDTCIKIGGYVRAEWDVQAGGSFNPVRSYNFSDPSRDRYTERARAGLTADVRSQTEYGTLRGYLTIFPTATNDNTVGGGPYATPGVFAPAMFIQFAGFTWGKTASFFDFDLQPYSNQTNFWGSNQAGNGQTIFGYTAQFGNGFSASISAEDPTSRRTSIGGGYLVNGSVSGASYGGRRWPDIVGNLHVDQAWGSAQIMGAIHDVDAVSGTVGSGASAVQSTSSATGWAIGGGVKFMTPFSGTNDYFIAQVEYSQGAMNYIASNAGAGAFGESLRSGFPVITNTALGPIFDGVVSGVAGAGGTGVDLTSGWSITAGYEHWWVPAWKTSLYGAYGQLNYGQNASTFLALSSGVGISSTAAATASANWSYWQIGSKTVWTPVPNLDLSVEIMYNKLEGAFGGLTGTAGTVGTFGNKDFVAGQLRAQRNFYP
jgi:hypothetical protein